MLNPELKLPPSNVYLVCSFLLISSYSKIGVLSLIDRRLYLRKLHAHIIPMIMRRQKIVLIKVSSQKITSTIKSTFLRKRTVVFWEDDNIS